MRRDAWVVLACLAVGTVIGWFGRAKKLRVKIWLWNHARWFRRLVTLRRLAVVLVAGALVPTKGTAQAPPDSLIGTVLSRNVIPAEWKPGQIGIYCLTWIAEREDRPRLLVIIDAAVADPNADPLCPDGRGGYYPLWVDGPICPPGQVSPFTDRDFVLIRCGNQTISRYRRPMPVLKRTEQ